MQLHDKREKGYIWWKGYMKGKGIYGEPELQTFSSSRLHLLFTHRLPFFHLKLPSQFDPNMSKKI